MNKEESVGLMIKGIVYSLPEAERAEFERHYQHLTQYVEAHGELAKVAVGLVCVELKDD